MCSQNKIPKINESEAMEVESCTQETLESLVENCAEMLNQSKEELSDESRIKETIEMFWNATDRRRTTMADIALKPKDIHLWGRVNKIQMKSATLNKLIQGANCNNNIEYKSTLETILGELDIKFRIMKLDSNPEGLEVLYAYETDCFEKWTFIGSGPTETEAIINAAKKGVDFFIKMAA